MKLVTLEQFQRLTGIADSPLLYLLKNRMIGCEYDNGKGIQIDVDSVNVKALVQSLAVKQRDVLLEEGKVLGERVARIVSENFDKITEEAISRFLAGNDREGNDQKA